MKFNKALILFSVFFLFFLSSDILPQSILNENNIKFENELTATIVGQDGLIMRTENGGLSWQTQSSGITNVLNSNDFAEYLNASGESVKLQLAVGENGIILKSEDDGITWTIIQSGTTENLNDVNIFAPNLIYACGDNGTLLRSADYGNTWESITVPTNNALNEIASLGPQTNEADICAIIAGANGIILGSVNMEDWTSLISTTTEDLLTAVFMGNIAICAGRNGTIIRSMNNGKDWSVMNSGITTDIYDLKFINGSILLGSSENGVLVRSENAGDSWTVISAPTTADLFAVNFGNEMFGISTGAEGTEIYTTDGGLTWAASMESAAGKLKNTEQFKLEQNYPNPFNPVTVINYSLSESSKISINVYDMTGKVVKSLVNSYQNAGSYSVSFNGTDLSSGIYFYVLKANTGKAEISKTMRMILIK